MCNTIPPCSNYVGDVLFQVVSAMMRKHLVESMVPILVELKRTLQAQKHPLLGDMMVTLRVLLKDHKTEVLFLAVLNGGFALWREWNRETQAALPLFLLGNVLHIRKLSFLGLGIGDLQKNVNCLYPFTLSLNPRLQACLQIKSCAPPSSCIIGLQVWVRILL